jgi:hypothetical protein
MTPGQLYDVLQARGLLEMRGAGEGVTSAQTDAAVDSLWRQIQSYYGKH